MLCPRHNTYRLQYLNIPKIYECPCCRSNSEWKYKLNDDYYYFEFVAVLYITDVYKNILDSTCVIIPIQASIVL